MNLHATRRARERILVVGIEGTGKTYNLLLIAQHSPDCTFYIIDNDNATDRLLEEEFPDLLIREEYRDGVLDETYCDERGTIILYHCHNGWESNKWAIEHAMSRADREDWIGIDSVTPLWDDVQEWFAQGIFGDGMAGYMMQVRAKRQTEREIVEKEKAKGTKGVKNITTLGALEGWMDWQVINPNYNDAVGKYLRRPPCHIYVTAEMTKLGDEDKKDKDITNLYGPYGVKAKGQKRNGHNVQTVLLLTKGARGDGYMVTTMKDRARPKFENDPFDNIVDDYLIPLAGFVDVEEVAATTPLATTPLATTTNPTKTIIRKKRLL